MIDHFLYIGTSLYIFSQSYVCPKLLLKHSRSRIPSYLCTGVARQVLPFEPHLQPYLCRKPFSRNATRYVARHLFICGGFDPRPCIRLRGNELFVCGGCPAVLPVPVLSPASGCVLVLPRALPGRGLRRLLPGAQSAAKGPARRWWRLRHYPAELGRPGSPDTVPAPWAAETLGPMDEGKSRGFGPGNKARHPDFGHDTEIQHQERRPRGRR